VPPVLTVTFIPFRVFMVNGVESTEPAIPRLPQSI
jgi:hypothetical protein